jgi:hypothetical protein
LHPVKAKEFFDATDNKSLALADFLHKMNMTTDIYGTGNDTDMIKNLTTNTSNHDKINLLVILTFNLFHQ